MQAETLCDAMYMVASGVPDRCDDHAVHIAELAIDLILAAGQLKLPDGPSIPLHIKVGILCCVSICISYNLVWIQLDLCN